MRSVDISGKQTATDFDLILNEIDIGLPSVKTEYIDIPLGNGAIDMTEALTGVVNYKNRTGKLSFIMVVSHSDRDKKLAEISAYVHGKRHKLILPDDTDHYYLGRLSITRVVLGAQYTTFDMNVTLDPYRYAVDETVIAEKTDDVAKTIEIVIDHVGRSVIPVFKNDKEVTFKSGTITQVINAGESKHTSMLIHEGRNVFEFDCKPQTNISLTYREEVL